MQVTDTSFVVVDTETTGGKAETNRIIELAAVRQRGGEITDRFSQLVNPKRSIPRRITQITGITRGMLYEEPTMAEVMPRFLEFLDDDVLVAHNMRFDKGFLNAELDRLGRPALDNDTLCTLRLARRLLRNLPSKGLSHLIDHYDLSIENRHRAFGDAWAAAQLLSNLLTRLAYEHDVEALEEVLAFQYCTYRKTKRPPKRLKHLRKEADDLPERPGVYCFRRKNGARLYIGKAKNLRKRVRSYLVGLGSKPKRTRKLVKHARSVTYEETATELEALLLESRLIKKHKPRFNRAQRRYRNRPFLRLSTEDRFPRLTTTAYPRDDGASYFGPVGGRRAADFVADLIRRTFKLRECDEDTLREGQRCLYAQMDRCHAPCEGGTGSDCYEHEVQRVRDFLTGRDDTVLDFLEQRMRSAAADLAFEDAQYYRDGYRRLKRLLDRQRQVAASVFDHHAVVIQPGADALHLLVVRFGRLAETYSLSCTPSGVELERIREQLRQHFEKGAVERPERYLKEEVEEVRLLAQWMYRRREAVRQVRRQDFEGVEPFLDAVLDQTAERVPKEAA